MSYFLYKVQKIKTKRVTPKHSKYRKAKHSW